MQNNPMYDERHLRITLSRELIHYRNTNSLTQRDMAKRLGINRHAYAKYEERKSTPTLMTYLLITALIGVSIYRIDKPSELHSHSVL
jgi:DNA-binding XRE family transcriptional regulator